MPIYYPDLKSVRATAIAMSKHKGYKKYTSIIPETEGELDEARQQLAAYFRIIWHDEIAALEVELAVTKENYHEKMREHILLEMLNSSRI